MKSTDIAVGQKIIGSGSKVFVIAEIGLNHNGSVSQAITLIEEAADAGADAVKFPSFRADRLLISSRESPAQQADIEESSHQILRRCELSFEDQATLKKHAEKRGVFFMSTPFDEESADFLDSLGVPLFKVASSDITHVPLLRHVASKGKPVFLSTGMSFLNEVADAVWNLKSGGAEEIVLMHSVSSHPAPPRDMNLRALQTLQSYFDLPVGLSDHSEGILLSLVAVALGAVVIEKHFALDRTIRGPDHKFGIEPAELKQLVNSLRDVEASLGDGRKKPSDDEERRRLFDRRSIVAAVDIRAGETIASWMLACKRPGSGIEPRNWEKVIGKTARRNLGKDTILQWDDLVPSASSGSGDDDSGAEREMMTLRTPQSGKRRA